MVVRDVVDPHVVSMILQSSWSDELVAGIALGCMPDTQHWAGNTGGHRNSNTIRECQSSFQGSPCCPKSKPGSIDCMGLNYSYSKML